MERSVVKDRLRGREEGKQLRPLGTDVLQGPSRLWAGRAFYRAETRSMRALGQGEAGRRLLRQLREQRAGGGHLVELTAPNNPGLDLVKVAISKLPRHPAPWIFTSYAGRPSNNVMRGVIPPLGSMQGVIEVTPPM